MCRVFRDGQNQFLRGTANARQRRQERRNAILFEIFIVAAAYRYGRMQHPNPFCTPPHKNGLKFLLEENLSRRHRRDAI
jgi:hypothetical protein